MRVVLNDDKIAGLLEYEHRLDEQISAWANAELSKRWGDSNLEKQIAAGIRIRF
tara:strand:- start:3078 stop:3239 length:162 start_codon:yes stop_codon:yes gene_type:complete